VVRWDVVEGAKVNVTFADGKMTHGGSGSWKVYNADQKKVLEAYGQMEKEALYLFFVKEVQGKEGVLGYMPLQYQAGFIYDDPGATIIAHELAHGAFNLWHTFSSEQFIASQGATANLMDYNNGVELWKHQWQLIDNPKNLWFKAWQDEEEGEMAGNNIYENQNNDGQPVDTVKAAQKVKDLVIVLQERIREYLKNGIDKYQKLAFENEAILSSISQFDPTLGAGGAYKNGTLYVGTRNFKENSTDEDILATLYHEYMHYLNWQFGDRYRMDNLEKGIVHQRRIVCYEERMQAKDEFLEDIYQAFIHEKMRTSDAEIYLDYPAFYKELTDVQKEEIDQYIEEKDLKPEIECVPYDYSPSNYFKDEINAHTETLKAHDANVFKMSDSKISVYHSEINRYTNSYNKAITYEINNNINGDGYDK
jgi:predicted SprT family Zn-dependent metalloprotease